MPRRCEASSGAFRVRGKARHLPLAQQSQERSPLTPTLSARASLVASVKNGERQKRNVNPVRTPACNPAAATNPVPPCAAGHCRSRAPRCRRLSPDRCGWPPENLLISPWIHCGKAMPQRGDSASHATSRIAANPEAGFLRTADPWLGDFPGRQRARVLKCHFEGFMHPRKTSTIAPVIITRTNVKVFCEVGLFRGEGSDVRPRCIDPTAAGLLNWKLETAVDERWISG
jgi:hypothetical protein